MKPRRVRSRSVTTRGENAKPVSSKRHALVGHLHRHAVVRHHRRDAGVDCGDERLQVIGEAAGRIDLPFAERVVRVEPHLLRPAAGKVLDGERDRRRRAHRSALQAGDQRAHDPRVEVGVLGERLVDAVPARLGGEIGGVAVHAAQADGAPLGAHHVGERRDRRQRSGAERGGRDAGFLRELGERAGAGRDAEARVGLVVIARVVLEDDGDAEPLPLGERLDGVGELGHLARRHRDAAKRRRRVRGAQASPSALTTLRRMNRVIFCVSTKPVAAGVNVPPQPAFNVSISMSPAFSSSVMPGHQVADAGARRAAASPRTDRGCRCRWRP